MDKNKLNGTADAICDDPAMNIAQFSSDCAPRAGGKIKLTCDCCSICCHDSDTSCNNLEWTANLDPIWEYGFGRRSYQFSKEVIPPDTDEQGGNGNPEP